MTDAKPTPPEAQPRLDLLLDLLAEAREEARWKGVLLAEAAKSRDDALRTIEGNVAEYQEQRQLLMVANGLAAEAAEECNRLRAELAESQGEVAQEQRRRERAEAERDSLRGGSRALPWRDAKTDPEAKPDDRANHLRLLLEKVDLRGRSFQIGAMGSGHYLQIVYQQPCVDTGEEKEQRGRKWYLSSHATDGEVVQTALKAALTSAEHEVREHFAYKGARVFGPHFDLDALVSLCQQGATQKRQS